MRSVETRNKKCVNNLSLVNIVLICNGVVIIKNRYGGVCFIDQLASFPKFFRLSWVKFPKVSLLSTPQVVYNPVPVLLAYTWKTR